MSSEAETAHKSCPRRGGRASVHDPSPPSICHWRQATRERHGLALRQPVARRAGLRGAARAPSGPRALAPPRAAQLPAAEPSLLRPKLPRRALRRRNGSPGWPARVERHTAGTGSREPGHFPGPRGPRSLQTPGRPAIRGPSPCSGAPSGGGSSSSDLRCWGLACLRRDMLLAARGPLAGQRFPWAVALEVIFSKISIFSLFPS